jgi:hypothetical protein
LGEALRRKVFTHGYVGVSRLKILLKDGNQNKKAVSILGHLLRTMTQDKPYSQPNFSKQNNLSSQEVHIQLTSLKE